MRLSLADHQAARKFSNHGGPYGVSIIMPTFNGSRFVEEALRSVLQQTCLPAEIIVVDDASSDGTTALVRRVLAMAPVSGRILSLAENSGGPARPINVGISNATGDLILILDQDDVLARTRLETDLAILREADDCLAVAHLCGNYADKVRTLQADELIDDLLHEGLQHETFFVLNSSSLLRLFLERGNFLYGYPGVTFRRSAWERRRGVEERFRIASDYDFFCWLCTVGKIAFRRAVGYFRRTHDFNLVSKETGQMLVEIQEVRARYAGKVAKPSAQLRRALLRQALDAAYICRERGHYGKALEIQVIALRTYGVKLRTFRSLGGLARRWLGVRL